MNAPECLDIFLESDSTYKPLTKYYNDFINIFKPRDEKEKEILDEMKRISNLQLSNFNNPLTAVRGIFEFCDLSSQNNKCQIPKLRYHYVDLRMQN